MAHSENPKSVSQHCWKNRLKLLSLYCAAAWSNCGLATTERNYTWLQDGQKIYVLQNRIYPKEGHLQLHLLGGFAKQSSYRASNSLDARANYYFTEELGFEVFYQKFLNRNNNTFRAIESTSVRPDVLEVQNQTGALFHWAPWYAKINIFNTIVYFDWYLAAGAGRVNVDAIPGSSQGGTARNTSYTAYYFGTGHQYHLTETWMLRLDFTNAWFQAPLRAVSGAKTWTTNSTFEFGVGIKL